MSQSGPVPPAWLPSRVSSPLAPSPPPAAAASPSSSSSLPSAPASVAAPAAAAAAAGVSLLSSSPRYRRFPGEPSLSFFVRERNSLCAYPRALQGTEGLDPAVVLQMEEEQFDLAWARLERKLDMTASIQKDMEEKGPPSLTAARHEKPTQQRQRQQRQRMKADKARKLMDILKLLLSLKHRP